jgi:hypothetical protein
MGPVMAAITEVEVEVLYPDLLVALVVSEQFKYYGIVVRSRQV